MNSPEQRNVGLYPDGLMRSSSRSAVSSEGQRISGTSDCSLSRHLPSKNLGPPACQASGLAPNGERVEGGKSCCKHAFTSLVLQPASKATPASSPSSALAMPVFKKKKKAHHPASTWYGPVQLTESTLLIPVMQEDTPPC